VQGEFRLDLKRGADKNGLAKVLESAPLGGFGPPTNRLTASTSTGSAPAGLLLYQLLNFLVLSYNGAFSKSSSSDLNPLPFPLTRLS